MELCTCVITRTIVLKYFKLVHLISVAKKLIGKSSIYFILRKSCFLTTPAQTALITSSLDPPLISYNVEGK